MKNFLPKLVWGCVSISPTSHAGATTALLNSLLASYIIKLIVWKLFTSKVLVISWEAYGKRCVVILHQVGYIHLWSVAIGKPFLGHFYRRVIQSDEQYWGRALKVSVWVNEYVGPTLCLRLPWKTGQIFFKLSGKGTPTLDDLSFYKDPENDNRPRWKEQLQGNRFFSVYDDFFFCGGCRPTSEKRWICVWS